MKGFKQFIMRGNVLDLAVAVVMGPPLAPWSQRWSRT
jgi:large-conductance mechanosensitive channel